MYYDTKSLYLERMQIQLQLHIFNLSVSGKGGFWKGGGNVTLHIYGPWHIQFLQPNTEYTIFVIFCHSLCNYGFNAIICVVRMSSSE